MEETRNMAQRCHALTYEDLPAEVVDRAKYLLLDYLGVAARGALSESSRPIQALLRQFGHVPDGAVVIGTPTRANPAFAALANGTAAHAIELDDVVNAASLHPGVTVMSAALAAAHNAGCTGQELIAAIVAGYEATIRLGIALDPAAHYAQGFHPTGTCGAFGAAVTAGKVLRLDRDALQQALGIAGSQAAGSMEFLSDGAFTKRLHAGWAAHSGLMAALLAREGFTGPATILEGRFGFLHAYSPKGDAQKILSGWGEPYQVMRTSIKPHACCRYKQGPIDGILKLMCEHQLQAADVQTVALGVLRAGFALVAEPPDLKCAPRSIVDAQFSMPFGAAVALLYGKASLEEYTLENTCSAEVQALMRKIICVEDPALETEFPAKWPASVTITCRSGDSYTCRIDYPKGDPENPLTWDELIAKFETLTRPVFPAARTAQILQAVRTIEQQPDVAALGALLTRDAV